ncbi:MAG: hypothetical protein K6E10_12540 [Eubacterium sp.]|nr:hypothetical protein [Eubacterium sp.]
MVEEFNDMNREYVAALVPDKMRLAELIKSAKGESRTMVEFAEKCGVITASSFSRIMHGNMTKPLSRELINAIFTNAVPTAHITYQELMRANGMIPADSDSVKNLETDEWRQENLEFRNARIKIKNCIQSALINRGILFRPHSVFFEDERELKYGLRTRANFCYELYDNSPKYWAISVNCDPAIERKLDKEAISRRYTRSFINDNTTLFLRDVWESESLAEKKNSIAFADRKGFELVKEKLEEIRVNSEISLILVDLDKDEVVEEYFLPRKGKKAPASLFDMPKIDTETYAEDEDFEMGMYDEEL